MRKKMTERFHVRLPSELKQMLDDYADKRLVPASAIIREALLQLFKKWSATEDKD